MNYGKKSSLNLPKGAFFLPIPDEFKSHLVVMPTSFSAQFIDDFFSYDEKERERRYLKQEDRQRHRAAHGLKRFLLSQLYDCDPKKLNFEYVEQGKPKVISESSNTKVAFNISHSGKWVIVGFSSTFNIGVDVETPRNIDINNMLDLVMHPKDIPEDGMTGFYKIWVMKEACIKATGKGMIEPLSSFSVQPIDTNRYRSVMPDGTSINGWVDYLEDDVPFAVAACE